MKKIDLTGKKFGKLTAVSQVGINKSGNALWLCKCDCGGETVAINSNLTRGNSTSCGCISREKTIIRNTKYSHSNHQLYKAWQGIQQRCNDSNCNIYRYYGGKGIKCCERWRDYEAFYSDNILKYKKGLTIDRINTNGDYSPENCRWVSMLIQANNKSNNRIVTAYGYTASLADVCRRFNADYKKTWKRLWRGWKIERALII